MNKAPEAIWLQHSDSTEHEDFPENITGVTWSPNQIFFSDVKYVRADLMPDDTANELGPRIHKQSKDLCQMVLDGNEELIDKGSVLALSTLLKCAINHMESK